MKDDEYLRSLLGEKYYYRDSLVCLIHNNVQLKRILVNLFCPEERFQETMKKLFGH